jgi:hypothetical protein
MAKPERRRRFMHRKRSPASGVSLSMAAAARRIMLNVPIRLIMAGSLFLRMVFPKNRFSMFGIMR